MSSADQAPDVLIDQKFISISRDRSLRVAAEQRDGGVIVTLAIATRGNAWIAGPALELLPHAVPEAIRALQLMAHAIGVRA